MHLKLTAQKIKCVALDDYTCIACKRYGKACEFSVGSRIDILAKKKYEKDADVSSAVVDANDEFYDWIMNALSYSQTNTVSPTKIGPLFPEDLELDRKFLVKYYMENVSHLLPILHPTDMDTIVDKGDSLLLTAICIWSLYYLARSQSASDPFEISNIFFKVARKFIAKGLAARLDNLQALLMISAYGFACGSCKNSDN